MVSTEGQFVLTKWSDVLVSTNRLTGSVAGTLSLKMKCNHFPFCWSGAGIEYRNSCWILQPTTNQFAFLSPTNDIVKHCYFTAEHLPGYEPPQGIMVGHFYNVQTRKKCFHNIGPLKSLPWTTLAAVWYPPVTSSSPGLWLTSVFIFQVSLAERDDSSFEWKSSDLSSASTAKNKTKAKNQHEYTSLSRNACVCQSYVS